MRDFTFDNNVSDTEAGKRKKDSSMTHLKYLRKRNGYTLEALSEITGISISYLSRLESGSRRLNTDLIRRLSHAFSCEAAELLQEVSHENIVTPVDFNRRKRGEYMPRETTMPLYCIAGDAEQNNKLTLRICSPTEWRQRPNELQAVNDVIAIKAEDHFRPHFSASSTLYLETPGRLTPESTVVILDQGNILIRKIWSITPTSLQLCDIGDIDALKTGAQQDGKLLNVDRNCIDAIYKVVGYSDFCLG
jgi:transcriptional regulator with XRE-family HTH domain